MATIERRLAALDVVCRHYDWCRTNSGLNDSLPMVLWWHAECLRRGIFWEGPVSDDHIRHLIWEKHKECGELSLEELHFAIE